MNTARIIVLVVAVGAGGIAAYLASGAGQPKPDQVTIISAPTLETTDILVSRRDVAMGQAITEADFQWQAWPSSSVISTFITRAGNINAPKQLAGTIARAPIIAGEPIREIKLVRADGSGFMAAILPEGMRAVSTEISPETGAGGFILPNDRVDVILSKRNNGNESNRDSSESPVSQIILSNVRVLAIDQTVEEKFDKAGNKTVIGKTATLELTPAQTETLAMARQTGVISLALRSLADASKANNDQVRPESKTSSVNMVRYGVSTKVMAK